MTAFCILILLLLQLCLLVPSSASGVQDYLGVYRWTATHEYNATIGVRTAIALPATKRSSDIYSFRIFTHQNDPADKFYLKGTIAEGNEFVLTMSLLNAANGSVEVTNVFTTTYTCFAYSPTDCEVVRENLLTFQNQILPIASTVNVIQLLDVNLKIEGPNGRFDSAQIADPLVAATTTTSDARPRDVLAAAVGSAVLVSISALLMEAVGAV